MADDQQKRSWLSIIPEIATGTVLALSVFYSAVSKLDPYFIVTIGLILYGALLASIFYRKHVDDKFSLAQLKRAEELEKTRMWHEQNRPMLDHAGKEAAERMARERTYMSVISVFEDTVKDTTRSDQERAIYSEIVRRLKDMQDASRF
jgi:hypothetical protein